MRRRARPCEAVREWEPRNTPGIRGRKTSFAPFPFETSGRAAPLSTPSSWGEGESAVWFRGKQYVIFAVLAFRAQADGMDHLTPSERRNGPPHPNRSPPAERGRDRAKMFQKNALQMAQFGAIWCNLPQKGARALSSAPARRSRGHAVGARLWSSESSRAFFRQLKCQRTSRTERRRKRQRCHSRRSICS